MNSSTDVDATKAPIASSGRSSSDLKRTHDLPMSSYLPALANASFNSRAFGASLYAHVRYTAQ